MKYSDLISFNPIEDVIQLTSADDATKAKEYVETYVMSDKMAAHISTTVIDQLQMDEVMDNKGVLIVGNYGTGKSHLMSVISAVANNSEYLQYLKNKKFAHDMERIAGKFEVLRFEFTGITMSLREFVLETIEEDFEKRGIRFDVPNLDSVRDNKKLIQDVMMAFNSKYPGKGYLLVVDELLNFLSSRNTQQLVLDLEFLRVLGEMCSKSKLRVIFGMQEKLFDNPKFGFVADTLGHVRDRITEMVIAKEDTAYVVSERILKKTPEQKALIREHLEKFSELYSGMSGRMDEFVNMFPIHPAYVDVFNKVYLIENRHVLKNISLTIKGIFNDELPEDAPGIISFDEYWPMIKQTPMLRTDPQVSRVLETSEKLEDIITHSFPKEIYKPLAIKIIYALSVHRLTTNGLDVQFGLTAENLKDDLCLYLDLPERDADFLLSTVKTTLKDIMNTVSGQFVVYNESNGQFFIDVNKTVDYDEKVKQRASMISDDELNRNFYKTVYSCLEWDAKQYVTNFEIYERDLNWDSHNMFREGYLFMGLPTERSTAQPERDFYIHFMPPYGDNTFHTADLPDEVYFYFKSSPEFREILEFCAAANELALVSEGKERDSYQQKADIYRKRLVRLLNENKNTCFEVGYKGQKQQLIEILKGRYNANTDFKDTIDLTSSICLDEHFSNKYPDYPAMKTKITRKNMTENVRQAFDYFAGRKSALAQSMLQSFDIMDGDKISPDKSKYGAYYIDMLKKITANGVINYSDIFVEKFQGVYHEDKRFHIENIFTPIIFLSLVYGGHATMTLKNGTILTASTLDQVPRININDLYEFNYLSKPTELPLPELKKLFGALDINPALLNNPNDREEGVRQLLFRAQELSNASVVAARQLQEGFELWGEPLVDELTFFKMQKACSAVKDEFSNYGAKFNTSAKLNNFALTSEKIDDIEEQINLVKTISELVNFKSELLSIVTYVSSIEFINLGDEVNQQIQSAKSSFMESRKSVANGQSGENAARKVSAELEKIRDRYIDIYFAEHKKRRLGAEDNKRKGRIQESLPFNNLRKMRGIEVLPGAKYTSIEQDLSSLLVCYELTTAELKANSVCPHCHFSLAEKRGGLVNGQLDDIEIRIDDLNTEWADILLKTISDPLVVNQKKFLSHEQQAVIDKFIESGKFPEKVDDFFVNSLKALLQDFKLVEIDIDEITSNLSNLGPCDVDTLKGKFNSLIDDHLKGKDKSNLRVVLMKKDREV